MYAAAGEVAHVYIPGRCILQAMSRHLQTLAIITFLVVVSALSYAAVRHNGEVGAKSTTTVPNQEYVNTSYGFSFSYPARYRLNEYTSRYVRLQNTATGDAVAEVSVEIADKNTFKNVDDFAHARASLTCSIAGSNGSTNCPSVSRHESFTGANGAAGEMFYLVYQSVSDSATTTREAGPFYAFDISANVPESQYAAFLVYPSHAAEESALYDEGSMIAHQLADSLRLTRSTPQ
jgi:hypothetical protein